MCLIAILVPAAIGLFRGTVSWVDTRGTRLSTVMAARYLSERKRDEAPRLPRGAFFSLLFAGIPLIKGRCPLFPNHVFLVAMLAVLWISIGTWLLSVSALQSRVEEQRKAYIEEFISSRPGNEPLSTPHFEMFPSWVKLRNRINLAAYFLFMASILTTLAAPSNS